MDIPEFQAGHGFTDVYEQSGYLGKRRSIPNPTAEPVVEGVDRCNGYRVGYPHRNHGRRTIEVKKSRHNNRKDELHSHGWCKRYERTQAKTSCNCLW